MPGLAVRHGRVPCLTCGHNPELHLNAARWVAVLDKRGLLLPSDHWEYYCEPCRAMLILGGETRDMVDLGDV